MNYDRKYMQLAIEKCKEGIMQGQSPFGACIVKNNEVVSCEHNIVWKSTDITAHAEINAIRVACKKLNSIDLSGCTIYSTCEPCPMCFAACHWARIDKIVFGTSIEDAKETGFNELQISDETLKKLGNSNVEIVSGFMKGENQELFNLWKSKKNKEY
ncbi:MAG: hypothetical protein UR26_C0010G0003 [candidate division TM6 bacterium GW2011_GWF2_32_72]|nr:MAG: hypothetical protein UR26_C0010G0003 [candidate division TM6 bacterium GW2011_GWF2_32_72]